MALQNHLLYKEQTATTKKFLKKTKKQAWITHCEQIQQRTTASLWRRIKWFTTKTKNKTQLIEPTDVYNF